MARAYRVTFPSFYNDTGDVRSYTTDEIRVLDYGAEDQFVFLQDCPDGHRVLFVSVQDVDAIHVQVKKTL